jgi:predicted nuclease with TOPRIM domain
MKDIIKKQEELIDFLESCSREYVSGSRKYKQLESELSVLKSKMEEVTDEDIEKASEVDFNKTNYYSYQHAYQNGAKAHRDGLIKKG